MINGVGDITDDILGRLENPQRSGSWTRIGLVVGHVQSGKTENYAGVINKALDAGYKIIIVLAGVNNDLRSQTQLRLDHDVVGYDSQRDDEDQSAIIGVATINQTPKVHSLTNSTERGDFNRSRAVDFNPGGKDPVILVVKKNGSVLKNILTWLRKYAVPLAEDKRQKRIFDVPLLVIDDEADHASIDSKSAKRDGDGNPLESRDPSKINGLVRKLLNLFDQKAYVGYTATPFANLFIYPILQEQMDVDYGFDLFPESFILNLPAPDNYTGPIQVFGLQNDIQAGFASQAPYPLVSDVDDYADCFPPKHKKDWEPPNLPTSVHEAIRVFVLTCAARRVRGQVTEHNSMLIHVTRFINVQRCVVELVKAEIDNLRRRIRYGDGNITTSISYELRDIWDRIVYKTITDFKTRMKDPLLTDVGWDDVLQQVRPVLDAMKIKEINGKASDYLDYHKHKDTGLTVIAIGGDKLSRGLTLEGLSVSYYLRPTSMYDTLLQMGRWFGYRPGYLDLCRLYTTPDLRQWYCHITLAYEELRQEFDRMVALKKTPRDYGLKVRSHPAGLKITATNKMRHSKRFRVSFEDTMVETYAFSKDSAIINTNYRVANDWLLSLGKDDSTSSRAHLWSVVSSNKVIEFIRAMHIHPDVRSANPDLLAQYINKQGELGRLNSWTIALISNTDRNCFRGRIAKYEKIGWTVRADDSQKPNRITDPEKYAIAKNHFINPPDEGIDLTPTEREEALLLTNEWRVLNNKPVTTNTSPQAFRFIRSRGMHGLMLIYLLTPEEDAAKLATIYSPVPYIGFALSFPFVENSVPIEYDANVIHGWTFPDDDVSQGG